MKPSGAPTGQRIVLELVKEMQERLYPLFYRTLAPGSYHVYLHPDDYREIEGVTSLIVLDAQQALNARVARLNRRPRWSTLLADRSAVEAPPGGWEIHIHPEANGELQRGQIGIVSRLSVPAAPRYDAGTPTARIVRTVVTGTARRSVATEEPGPPPIPAGPAPMPALPQASPATPSTERPVGAQPVDADNPQGFARLAYVDEQGSHVYAMNKDVVSIGRGGREHWVDIQLVTTARVSREHCRIRRDPQGRFFLHDLSTWGTSIDGRPVRPLGWAEGAPAHEAEERELPPQARIQLADAVVIEFQVQSST
jgi:pSer/pThr/pTyr-binding forkhead associated (FHA) protein